MKVKVKVKRKDRKEGKEATGEGGGGCVVRERRPLTPMMRTVRLLMLVTGGWQQ